MAVKSICQHIYAERCLATSWILVCGHYQAKRFVKYISLAKDFITIFAFTEKENVCKIRIQVVWHGFLAQVIMAFDIVVIALYVYKY